MGGRADEEITACFVSDAELLAFPWYAGNVAGGCCGGGGFGWEGVCCCCGGGIIGIGIGGGIIGLLGIGMPIGGIIHIGNGGIKGGITIPKGDICPGGSGKPPKPGTEDGGGMPVFA